MRQAGRWGGETGRGRDRQGGREMGQAGMEGGERGREGDRQGRRQTDRRGRDWQVGETGITVV